MKCPKVTTIDFETEAIETRPEYPPKPVGVAIREYGKKDKYFAWGHPEGNNCSKADAKRMLKNVWKPGKPTLFFNAKFDIDVGETHLGLPRLLAEDIHDAQLLMFLRDPHAKKSDLKSLGENYLGEPPDEQDEVREWVMAHKAELMAEHGRFTPSQWGRHICHAPGKLVGKYAKGDTRRTIGLFQSEWDWVINDHEMYEAYRREQKVMPIFLENERQGIRLDVKGLRRDIAIYQKALQAADDWLRKRLGIKELSLDNNPDVAQALLSSGVVREEDFTLTPTGKLSVAKGTLTPDLFQDPRVAAALGYRNRLTTCLKMFMLPWLEQADRRGDGHISTNWNQVRSERGGTRTGRPSCTNPNFLNISKSWDNNDDGYLHPDHLDCPELPLVRRYLLPDKGEKWLHRDYNGQELRLLAHFENGPLMEAYQEDPWLDVHQHVADLIETTTGQRFERKKVKIANFRIIYGGGAPATAKGIGCTLDEAKGLLGAHGKALPSVNGKGGINEQIKGIGRSDECIFTWGGRAYYVEPPAFNKKHGREMTFEYKLLNYLCQGSAADVTKQAMINYHEHPDREGRFLVQVYDEVNASGGPHPKHEMQVLRDSMEMVSEQMDVPMLSEGKWGGKWGTTKPFKEGKSNYVPE